MKKQYDVLIAGAGAAGLYAALQFEGCSVLLLSKRELTLSNSSLAQGGVASVQDPAHDGYALHVEDTLIAGGYRNDIDAVDVLVREGPSNVQRINRLGVDFDRNAQGGYEFGLEGGHCRHRIVHHKDSTGREIVNKLLARVCARANVDIAENTQLFDLRPAPRGFFAQLLLPGGTPAQVEARFCILATGGIGRVYQYTTNSAIATGDGIALAHRLGAPIRHLNWVQFHPTAFAAEADRERFLISEAVRGEGATLLNCDGDRFMFRYDERGELAPRDVVSHAIMVESQKTGNEHFYLDITQKEPEFVKNRFPMIYSRCLEEGVDITRDRIPVFPCQHYLMGGIGVDLHGRTGVDRLYAAGECSHTGVHGKNRLASNSLLEALVFSRRAAQDIMARLMQEKAAGPVGETPAPPSLDGRDLPHGLRTEVRSIMQHLYFVIPRPADFPAGLARVEEIVRQLRSGGYAITPDYIEACSLATVAQIILRQAIAEENEKQARR